MSWWPFNKKKLNSEIVHVIKPSEDWIKECSEGNIHCVYLPYQYINWCYEYLGSGERVNANDACCNKHVVVMTGACSKYVEDNSV